MISEEQKAKLSQSGLPEISEGHLAILKSLKSGQDFALEQFNSDQIILLNCLHTLQRIEPDESELLPRAIILCSNTDTCYRIEEYIKLLSGHGGLVVVVTHDKGKKVQQRIDLYSGCDVVIGNPKRICELYFQNGINLKNLKLISILDANPIATQGGLTPILRLNESINKCQKLVFFDQENSKIENLLEEFLIQAKFIHSDSL